MASFLDATEDQRRLYVARMLGLSPSHPESWPLETINGIIERAEERADKSILEDVWVLTRRL